MKTRKPRALKPTNTRRKRGLARESKILRLSAGLPATIADPGAKRRKGAQPGNDRAVKHDFYSSLFKDPERQLLAGVPLTDLSSEIGLIRITSEGFFETLAASQDALDFDTQLTAVRAINLSAHSIASLLRAHALAAAADNDPLPPPSRPTPRIQTPHWHPTRDAPPFVSICFRGSEHHASIPHPAPKTGQGRRARLVRPEWLVRAQPSDDTRPTRDGYAEGVEDPALIRRASSDQSGRRRPGHRRRSLSKIPAGECSSRGPSPFEDERAHAQEMPRAPLDDSSPAPNPDPRSSIANLKP